MSVLYVRSRRKLEKMNFYGSIKGTNGKEDGNQILICKSSRKKRLCFSYPRKRYSHYSYAGM